MGTTVEAMKSSFTNKYYLRSKRVITAFEARNILNQRHVNAGNIFVEGTSLRITPEAAEYLADRMDPTCTRVLAEAVARVEDAAELPEKVWKSVAERCYVDPLLPIPFMIGLVSKKQRKHVEDVLNNIGLDPGVMYVKEVTEKRGDQLLLRLSENVKEEYFPQSTHYSWFLGDLLWYGSYVKDESVRKQLFAKIGTWPNTAFALPFTVLKNLSEPERTQLDGSTPEQWSRVEWDADAHTEQAEVGEYIIRNVPGVYKRDESSLKTLLFSEEVYFVLQDRVDVLSPLEEEIYEHTKFRWDKTLESLLKEVVKIAKSIERYPEIRENFLVLNKEFAPEVPVEEVLRTARVLTE